MNENSLGRMWARYVHTLCLVSALTGYAAARASAADITYTYDDLGRLHQVIDEHGEVATYNYDAVGNILSIERGTGECPVGPPMVTHVTFDACSAGTRCSLVIDGSSLLDAAVSTDTRLARVNRCRGNCSRLTCSLDTATSLPPGAVHIVITTPLGLVSGGTLAILPPAPGFGGLPANVAVAQPPLAVLVPASAGINIGEPPVTVVVPGSGDATGVTANTSVAQPPVAVHLAP